MPNNERTPDKLRLNIRTETLARDERQRQLRLMDRLNQLYLGRPGTPAKQAGVEATEAAFRMQMEASEVFDIKKENQATRNR